MNIQEAYNKGLDVAENDAYDKLTKALDGYDVGPFANPKMEELRQRLLFTDTKDVSPDTSYLLKFFKNEEIDESMLSSTDVKILELLRFCKRSIPKRPTSKITIMLRALISDIEIDILKNDDKLN